jgi:hypothetical protein
MFVIRWKLPASSLGVDGRLDTKKGERTQVHEKFGREKKDQT